MRGLGQSLDRHVTAAGNWAWHLRRAKMPFLWVGKSYHTNPKKIEPWYITILVGLRISIFLGFTTYCIVGNDLKPIGYLGMDWNRGLLSHPLGKGMMMDEMENQSSLGMIWTSDSTTFSLEKHILVGDDFIPSFRKWIMMMVLGWLICNVVNPMRNHPQNYHI